MGVRRIVVGLSLAVMLTGCSSIGESAEPGSPLGSDTAEQADQPESLALVEQNSARPLVELDSTRPTGLTETELSGSLPDRIALLSRWLQSFEAARTVGNLPLSGDVDQGHEIEFLVRTNDPREAATLCPIYDEAMALYTSPRDEPVQIWLSGWTPNEAGIFTDPGWDRISCSDAATG